MTKPKKYVKFRCKEIKSFYEKQVTYDKLSLLPVETNIERSFLLNKDNIVVKKEVLWGDVDYILMKYTLNDWSDNVSILPSTYITSKKSEIFGSDLFIEGVSSVLLDDHGYFYFSTESSECDGKYYSCTFNLYRFEDDSFVSINTPNIFSVETDKKYPFNNSLEYISNSYIKYLSSDELEFLVMKDSADHLTSVITSKLRYSISNGTWTYYDILEPELLQKELSKNLHKRWLYTSSPYYLEREQKLDCFSYHAPGGDLVFIRHQLHEPHDSGIDKSELFDLFYFKIK